MRTVIYGNGAMARVLLSYARHDREIAGFTVDDHLCADDGFCGRPLVPFSRVAEAFVPGAHRMLIAVGYLEMNQLRARKHDEAAALGYGFDTYVHPSVMIHDGVVIEEGSVVLDHVAIHPGSRIGRGSFIAGNANLGHDCEIGAFSWINGGVSLAGGCRVGPGCFFGVNAAVAQGVRIGARNFIAAGALINRDTEDDQVYVAPAAELFPLDSRRFLKFSRMTD